MKRVSRQTDSRKARDSFYYCAKSHALSPHCSTRGFAQCYACSTNWRPKESGEEIIMGMFDAPQYLTGKEGEGYVQPGDTFWLHNAKMDGTVTLNGKTLDQVKLRVSRTVDGERENVFSSGIGIANQVRRMDDKDRQAMPIQVRLDQIPSKQGSPTHVLTPAEQQAPTPPSEAADF